MTIPFVYVGCDISKHFLDVFDSSDGAVRRIEHHSDAIANWLYGFAGKRAFIVFEATGSYDRELRHARAAFDIVGAPRPTCLMQ